ncbi:PQQ-like beta-propeller repeat protein [bacterium]|nr:PQQ-like beta-propeller repeat protein [Verrucomicrobiales bacterium]MDC0311762.1 PQQ-like beta-propeller repeat protein [bacterium]
MKKLHLLAAICAFASFANAQDSEFRKLTSTDGKTIGAKVVKIEGANVTIERADGKQFTIPGSKFSDADKDYFRAWKPAEAAASAATSSDWFQWRGPNRDGVSAETGLNTDWDAKEPELLWRTSGLNGGMSSLSIYDGKLFTMGERDGGTIIHCRNIEDGAEVWTASVAGKGSPNCTPTVDPAAGLVYGVSRDGELSAVKIDDGSLAWSKSYSGDFGGKMMSQWGFSESPLIDGEHLICTPGAPDALLAALNKTTGEVIWKTNVAEADLGSAGKDGAGYGSVVISNADDVKHYIQLVGRGLVGVSPEDGSLMWNYNRIANGTANVPTPIISGDYVFGSTGYGDGGSALLKLSKSGSKMSAKEEYYYNAKELQNHHGGMILVGDHIYLGEGHNNGFPQCIELKSGEIKWGKQRGAGSESAAIAYADGHIFFRYQDHTMAVVEANPSEYKLKGSFKIGSSNKQSWPHPVIQDGKLYLRDQDELLCYDISG